MDGSETYQSLTALGIAEPWAFEPLTPTSFLRRTAAVYPDRTAVVDGDMRFSYSELHDRSARLAGSLRRLSGGRPVAVLAPNSHVLVEAHHAVPWSGSPLVALNTRLLADELAWIIRHSEASVLIHSSEYAETAERITSAAPGLRTVMTGDNAGGYEELVAEGKSTIVPVADERGLLSINYTSGTTGQPKGVMYHHRGAYLQALAMVVHAGLSNRDNYLWTLPMFHANGWCFTWAVTAASATHVCLRHLDADEVWRLIDAEGVSVFCAAPTVLTMIAHASTARVLDRPVRVLTGGSPPTPAIIAQMERLGIGVTHLYELTKTFGPIVVCDWHPEWDAFDLDRRATLIARQGVGNLVASTARVVDSNGGDVPCDGSSTGEIALRGNTVMLGYLKDNQATAAAIPDGWFRTGDLGVMHPDGYLEVRDRSKDVIISGGENISSVEVEAVLCDHPDVLECAVVARSDPHWGEVPVAYVDLIDKSALTEVGLIEWARERLAHFKAPKYVVFTELPKTSTGKVQKFSLRRAAEELSVDHKRG